jgi:hypothetical protein
MPFLGTSEDRGRERDIEALQFQDRLEARIKEAEDRLALIRGDLLYVDDTTSEMVRNEIADVQSILVKLRKIPAELQIAEEPNLGEVQAKARLLMRELEDHFETIDSLLGPIPQEAPWDDWLAAVWSPFFGRTSLEHPVLIATSSG